MAITKFEKNLLDAVLDVIAPSVKFSKKAGVWSDEDGVEYHLCRELDKNYAMLQLGRVRYGEAKKVFIVLPAGVKAPRDLPGEAVVVRFEDLSAEAFEKAKN
jgi:hypothetical protein